MRLSRPVLSPAELEPKEVKAIFPGVALLNGMIRVFSGDISSPNFPSRFSQLLVEAFRVFLMLEGAHKIIRIPDQARFPSTVGLTTF